MSKFTCEHASIWFSVFVPPSGSRRRRAPTWSKCPPGCSWPARRNRWGQWWLHGEWSALWNPAGKNTKYKMKKEKKKIDFFHGYRRNNNNNNNVKLCTSWVVIHIIYLKCYRRVRMQESTMWPYESDFNASKKKDSLLTMKAVCWWDLATVTHREYRHAPSLAQKSSFNHLTIENLDNVCYLNEKNTSSRSVSDSSHMR